METRKRLKVAKTSFFDILGDASGRLFHVDRDCFLIYAGSTLSEERPYMRIGASDRIPDALLARTSVLILSDYLFQNLYKEIYALKTLIAFNEKVPRVEGQEPDFQTLTVVGTQKQIDLYKLGLTAHPVPNEYFEFVVYEEKKGKTSVVPLSFDAYQKIEEIHDAEKTILSASGDEILDPVNVSFSGSTLELRVGKDKVFDIFTLRGKPHTRFARENDLVGRFIYKGEVRFYERGFILLSSHMLYYDRYQFFQSGVPADNFEEYMKADVNPDTLRIVHEAVSTEELEAFYKNREDSRKKITILTSEAEPLNFIKNHYAANYVTTGGLPEKFVPLSDTRIHFEPSSQAIVFEPPKDYPEVHYFYPLSEIYKKDLVAKRPWLPRYNPVLRKEVLADKIPTELTGEISIIPREFYSPELKTKDHFVLVYDTRAKERYESGFEGLGSVYKIFPFIDYRFSKRFAIMARLTYAVDLYLTQMVNIQRKVIRAEYARFVDLISKLLEEYVNKNINFRKFLLLLLNYTQAITGPRNRFEYFLLHNSIEFIRYLKDVLETKGVPSMDLVEKALASLVSTRNGAVGLEISDCRIKGNINRLPNGKKYLFYSLAYGNYPPGLSRQHEVVLHPELVQDHFLVNEDIRRREPLYSRFATEVHDSAQLHKIKLTQAEQAKEVISVIEYFEEETRRLRDLEGFLEKFKTFTEREKKNFYLLVKKHKGLLDPLEEEELIFDNLFEKFQFTKIKTGRVLSKAEKVARLQRTLAWCGLGVAALALLFVVFINLPILDRVKGLSTARNKVMAMSWTKKLYVVDTVYKMLGIDYAEYADLGGKKPSIAEAAKNKFPPALKVLRSDVADTFNKILNPTGAKNKKRIYDAKDLAAYAPFGSLTLPSGQTLAFSASSGAEDVWETVLDKLKAEQTRDLNRMIELELRIKEIRDLVSPRDAKGKNIPPKLEDLEKARAKNPEAIAADLARIRAGATSRYTAKIATQIENTVKRLNKELEKKIQGAHHVKR